MEDSAAVRFEGLEVAADGGGSMVISFACRAHFEGGPNVRAESLSLRATRAASSNLFFPLSEE